MEGIGLSPPQMCAAPQAAIALDIWAELPSWCAPQRTLVQGRGTGSPADQPGQRSPQGGAGPSTHSTIASIARQTGACPGEHDLALSSAAADWRRQHPVRKRILALPSRGRARGASLRRLCRHDSATPTEKEADGRRREGRESPDGPLTPEPPRTAPGPPDAAGKAPPAVCEFRT